MPRRSLLALLLVLALPAAAQPSAQAVVERATARYMDMMKGVQNYTVTQEVMGHPATIYFERVPGGGPLDFAAHPVGADGEAMDGAGTMDAHTGRMLRVLAERGRMAGTHDVDGTATYAIAADDFQDVIQEMQGLNQAGEDADIERATFYFDQEDYRLLRVLMEGEMTMNDRRSPFTATMTFSDFRTVDGLTHPFSTTMSIAGVQDAMSDKDREQLEEARRQMENMPEAQRKMMERMMGDQLKKLEEMMGGEAIEMDMTVTDLQVNAGRPD